MYTLRDYLPSSAGFSVAVGATVAFPASVTCAFLRISSTYALPSS